MERDEGRSNSSMVVVVVVVAIVVAVVVVLDCLVARFRCWTTSSVLANTYYPGRLSSGRIWRNDNRTMIGNINHKFHLYSVKTKSTDENTTEWKVEITSERNKVK